MTKDCLSVFPSVTEIPGGMLHSIRATNSAIASLNIIGNIFLIYALKQTGQTRTISIKFVASISISGLFNGIIGISATNLLLQEQFQNSCLLNVTSQVVIGSTNPFSYKMLLVIALDRYLHMKLLSRYPSVMSNKRGQCLLFSCICSTLALVVSQLLVLFMAPEEILVLQVSFGFVFIPLVVSMAVLYYKAYKNLHLRATSQVSPIIRNALLESKRFTKVAKRIVFSVGLLTSPVIVSLALRVGNRFSTFMDHTKFDILLWFGLLFFSAISFSNSVIFILHNRLVKSLLKRLLRRGQNRIAVIHVA